MNILSKLFSKKQTPPSVPEEQLVPVPIPALGVLLLNVEQKKGSPLNCHCGRLEKLQAQLHWNLRFPVFPKKTAASEMAELMQGLRVDSRKAASADQLL